MDGLLSHSIVGEGRGLRARWVTRYIVGTSPMGGGPMGTLARG